MINLRHIEVFRAIMTAGSVTNAAQLLHTSQPTVSRELARLEYLVGFELFERGRGRLHATARAVVLFQEVELAFIGLDRIVSFAESLSRFSQGAFSVACIPAFSHALLPQVCKNLIANHPGVSVEIAPLESPWLEEQLTLQRHDVGLTEHDEAPPGTELQLLMSVDEVCILPDGHPLLEKHVLSLNDVSDQTFVSFSKGDRYRRVFDVMFKEAGIDRFIQVETHSAVSVCSMVQAGLGIAILNPLTAIMFQGQGVNIRPLAFSLPFQISLVKPLYRSPTPFQQHFTESLQLEISLLAEQLASLGVSVTLERLDNVQTTASL